MRYRLSTILLLLSFFLLISCLLDIDSSDGDWNASSSSEVVVARDKYSSNSETYSSSEQESTVDDIYARLDSLRASREQSSASETQYVDAEATWEVPFTTRVSSVARNPVGEAARPELAELGELRPATMLSAADWELLFPRRAGVHYLCHGQEGDFYTYEAFIEATQSFPAFASEGPDEVRKRELAAFLANISHETTGGSGSYEEGADRYFWGLCWLEELSYVNSSELAYRDESNAQYPPAPGVSYHGRGPIQLTWNYNYGLAGDDLEENLLLFPVDVISDPVLAFKSALWFWMKEQYPKPSAHDAMLEVWEPTAADIENNRLPGFGVTINIINGYGECGTGSEDHPGPPDRIGYFYRFSDFLNVSPGRNIDCYEQHDFRFQ
jgi:hypothetical protein